MFDRNSGTTILEPNAEPAIVTQALARRFRDLVAVADVSMTVLHRRDLWPHRPKRCRQEHANQDVDHSPATFIRNRAGCRL